MGRSHLERTKNKVINDASTIRPIANSGNPSSGVSIKFTPHNPVKKSRGRMMLATTDRAYIFLLVLGDRALEI